MDQHLREEAKLKEEQQPHKLKKKKKVDQEEQEIQRQGEEEEQVQEEVTKELESRDLEVNTEREREEVAVETIVMELVEETEEILPTEEELPLEPSTSSTESTHFSSQRNTSPSTSSPPPSQQTPSTSFLGDSIVFAPARLGWRIASGTIHFGLDTSKNVARRVPIVGRLVPNTHTSPSEELGESEELGQDEEEEEVSLPSPPENDTDSEISFAPSTASALIREHQKTLPALSQQSPLSTPTTTTRQKELRKEEEEHGLVYKAAELSLGLGIAGVLVTSALGKMAWQRVVTGSATSRPGQKE